MKKFVSVIAVIYALSLFVPATVTTDVLALFKTAPVVEVSSEQKAAGTDAAVVAALKDATPADKARVYDVYTGMAQVLKNDKGHNHLTTSEQFAIWHGKAIEMANDSPPKNPNLGVAIDAVIKAALKTDDVIAITPTVRDELITACYRVANSAQ